VKTLRRKFPVWNFVWSIQTYPNVKRRRVNQKRYFLSIAYLLRK